MMKKIAMMMAFALAGVASAITVSWNGNTGVGAGTHTLTTTTNFSTNNTITIVLSGVKYADWTAAQGPLVLFTVYGNNGTAGANGIDLGGTGEGNGSTPKHYFTMGINDQGQLTYNVAGNRGEPGEYHTAKAIGSYTDLFAENDTLTLTLTKTGTYPQNIQMAIGENVYTLGNSNSPFGFASYEWNKITVTSVPEPTALALLALGVAGLALKRKVA